MQIAQWISRARRIAKQSPAFLLLIWFSSIQLLGAILLALPVAHRPGGPEVHFLAALFTAVSAFCVTGLTVVDTHDAFSAFGQTVIMLLIELSGIGVMTFAKLAFTIIRRRFSIAEQVALTDTLFQNDVAREFSSIFRSMLRAVILIQGVGVVVLFLILRPIHMADGQGQLFALWSALFHTVSAFCNAGFSIYQNNLVPMSGSRAFLAAIMALIILGGLGHGVLAELYRLPRLIKRAEKKPHWLSFNTRVCLLTTTLLLVFGAVLVGLSDLVFGNGGTDGLWDSVFHSVSARTAGFNSADIGKIPLTTCLFLCLLMFVGGSPGSCAGGIKTTSLAIWIATIKSGLRHEITVKIFGYTISRELVSKAFLIVAVSALWVMAGTVLLSITQPGEKLELIFFEQVSALATVGLSMNLTPRLTDFSQVWIIASMIMGKFGPLTVAMWMVMPVKSEIGRPMGRLMVG